MRRPIPGFERYEVTEDGRIWSTISSRWLRPACANGYLRYSIQNDKGVSRGLLAHVAVALAFLGPRPEGMQVRHLDTDKSNNHRLNLAWGTAKENRADYEAQRPEKRYCTKGHAMIASNVAHTPEGKPRCKTCVRHKSRWQRLESHSWHGFGWPEPRNIFNAIRAAR